MEEDRIAVVIEDDADIRSLLHAVLEQAGFQVFTASNGLDGVELMRQHDPAVVTLDVSMPGMDGFETARRIRAFSDAYLVMLSARTDEIDTLQGLEAGADDYVTKPFRPRELRARIDAMLRRPRRGTANSPPVAPSHETPQFTMDAAAPGSSPSGMFAGMAAAGWLEHKLLRMHPDDRVVTVDGKELNVELTRSEFEILRELLESGRRVVSKQDLALMLRGEPYFNGDFPSESDARAIEVHIANLRRKLSESATVPRWIETVRGVGYRLTAP